MRLYLRRPRTNFRRTAKLLKQKHEALATAFAQAANSLAKAVECQNNGGPPQCKALIMQRTIVAVSVPFCLPVTPLTVSALPLSKVQSFAAAGRVPSPKAPSAQDEFAGLMQAFAEVLTPVVKSSQQSSEQVTSKKREPPEKADPSPAPDTLAVVALVATAGAPLPDPLPFHFGLKGDLGHSDQNFEQPKVPESTIAFPSSTNGPIAAAPPANATSTAIEQTTAKLQIPLAELAEPLPLPASLTIPELSGEKQAKGAIAFEAHLKPHDVQMPSAAQQPIPIKMHADLSPEGLAPAKDAAALPASSTTNSENPKAEKTRATLAGREDKPAELAQPFVKPSQKESPQDKDHTLDPNRIPAAAVIHAAEPSARNVQLNAVVTEATPVPRQTEPARAADKLPAAVAPELPEPPAPRTEPARDISFRIASATHPVDIKLVERAGEIHVAVRSIDAALTKSLQANVSELAGKLERSGFHAETFLPGKLETLKDPQANAGFQDAPRDRRAPQNEPPRPKKAARNNDTTFEISMLQNTTQENR